MELNIEIDQECPICFNNIQNDDGFLLLSCCNKNVHISCLEDWYNNNGKKNKFCFLCTKESKDLESIIVTSPIIENDNRTIINNSNYIILKLTISFFILFLLLTFILLFIYIKVFE